jgi:hypothetical protein
MNNINKQPLNQLGYGFIDPRYLPQEKDEYYLRETQQFYDRHYRSLTDSEIKALEANENTSDNWVNVWVTDLFNPDLIKRCQFFGLVRIGNLENYYLEYHDLRLPVGLYDSTIVSCDIGSNVVIDSVRYLAHTIIADEVILLNVDEMMTTNYAKFGNSIIKEGEDEAVRIWLDLGNENGGRAIAPFDGMLPADAWLWAKYRDNETLMNRLREMTDAYLDRRRGYYGAVGERTVIKNCGVIKDVRIGSDAYIKGANKLKNLTIHSNADEPSQIGEGVELVNGIIGYGCRIFYGVKAVRFIMGTNACLKYGARLIHSYLGDNSTISCCEVLNSLIFPAHEQHHNSSFLCAAVVQGQCNMAAGVTAGANHNSRTNDGELFAKRGFWPGLCASLKYNSRFASYTLLAKGHYPNELNITLPFSLVLQDSGKDTLSIMPAYWFMYNMYSLARNSWKFADRDKRVHKGQQIEYDALAPDTLEEILEALDLLETWTGKAKNQSNPAERQTGPDPAARKVGRKLLQDNPESVAELEIRGEGMENARRPVCILKTDRAWQTYREMAHYYTIRTLVLRMHAQNLGSVEELKDDLSAARRGAWINMGGQLIREEDVQALIQDIIDGKIASWGHLHETYADLWERYPRHKAEHALASLLDLHGLTMDSLDSGCWLDFLDQAVATGFRIAEWTSHSREKDYQDPFRKTVYDSPAEMEAVLGSLEDNGFIQLVRQQAEQFESEVRVLMKLEASPERV